MKLPKTEKELKALLKKTEAKLAKGDAMHEALDAEIEKLYDKQDVVYKKHIRPYDDLKYRIAIALTKFE